MAELKGKVIAGKVLIQPEQSVTKTSGGIIIPDSAKEKPNSGKVILVGLAKSDEIVEVSIGDTVFYPKYVGTEISIDGTDYLLISQSDILFIA